MQFAATVALDIDLFCDAFLHAFFDDDLQSVVRSFLVAGKGESAVDLPSMIIHRFDSDRVHGYRIKHLPRLDIEPCRCHNNLSEVYLPQRMSHFSLLFVVAVVECSYQNIPVFM